MPKAEWTSRVERIDKPWGFETHFALVPGKYCGKTLHVDAGHALSPVPRAQRGDDCCAIWEAPVRSRNC
jgi:hypothetical protein